MPGSIDRHKGTNIEGGDCAEGERLVLRFHRGVGAEIGDGLLPGNGIEEFWLENVWREPKMENAVQTAPKRDSPKSPSGPPPNIGER